LQHVPAQTERVGVAHVVDPALHTRVELGEAQRAGKVGTVPRPKVPRGMAHFAGLCTVVIGEGHEPEPWNVGADRRHLRAGGVDVRRNSPIDSACHARGNRLQWSRANGALIVDQATIMIRVG
jgi:hypothetical protein